MVRHSIVWLAAACFLATPSWSQNYTPDFTEAYTQFTEVTNPQPAQTLTVFLPRTCPPDDTGLYPVLLYTPAAAFAAGASAPGSASAGTTASLEDGFGEFAPVSVIDDGNPGHPDPLLFPRPPSRVKGAGGFPAPSSAASAVVGPLFLTEALNRGWAVVTVGTTGHNSWPTCSQAQDCNLWYEPGSLQWNNFNLFWGEKELLWARQWVGLYGADHCLDTNRVVVCGTSTGAIYASSLAFGPNRAWGGNHSPQLLQDTRVAAIVAFEPVTWVKGLNGAWPAPHWSSSRNTNLICAPLNCSGACFNRRAGSLASVAGGLLEQSSVSRWVREAPDTSAETGERPTPIFIAAGDGKFSTDFQRNASQFPEDYMRYECDPDEEQCDPDLIEGDPLIAFASGPGLGLHDSWYAMNFALDLQMLDAAQGTTFHEDHSRLFLQVGLTWGNLPASLSTRTDAQGMPIPPCYPDEVRLLDGTFAKQGLESSIWNADLVPKVVTWMDEELGVQHPACVVLRNPTVVGPGGASYVNPEIYSLDAVLAGKPTEARVDLNNSVYDMASVLVFTEPFPGIVLSGGQVLLCNIGSYLFSSNFVPKNPSTGIAGITLGPATPACISFSTQAILVDLDIPKVPFGLTNAQDFTVQP